MKKILIIEDDKLISSMYNTKLKIDGYKVFLADTGLKGFKKAKEKKPDLIMLDVILPELDGFSVLEKLKNNKQTKNIPVMMLTNLGTDEDVDKGKKLGAIDYLVKANFTPAEISKKIKKYLK